MEVLDKPSRLDPRAITYIDRLALWSTTTIQVALGRLR
jgi:hypothetical protein